MPFVIGVDCRASPVTQLEQMFICNAIDLRVVKCTTARLTGAKRLRLPPWPGVENNLNMNIKKIYLAVSLELVSTLSDKRF